MTQEEEQTTEARRQAARLMGSVMTPAKYAAVLKAAQTAGRKKGTPQSEETKAKIAASRRAQEQVKREQTQTVSGTVPVEGVEKKKAGRPPTRPIVDASGKKPVGRPRRQNAAQGTEE